jgi:spermidine/putrescine-binding protein
LTRIRTSVLDYRRSSHTGRRSAARRCGRRASPRKGGRTAGRVLFPLLGVSLTLCVAGWLYARHAPRQDSRPVLSVFCFQGYTEPEWVRPFEREHSCRVRITYTSTIEEMFEQVSRAPEAFHLVSIDSGRVRVYRQAGLIQPIDVGQLRHYASIRPFFREHEFGRTPDGDVLHVPIVWGTQTLTVNRDRVSDRVLRRHLAPDGRSLSLDILTDPELHRHTGFFDEAANVFAIAAMHAGVKDPHHLSPAEWQVVERRTRQWMSNAAVYTTGLDSEFNALAGEQVWVLLGGNDALLNQRLEEAGIRGRFSQYPPTEGTYCWIDGWAITARTTGRNLELAHAYIDRMISDEGQRLLAREVGFGPVTEAGSDVLPEAVRTSAYWYADAISRFPGKLCIMAPEEDTLRRVERWKALKAVQYGQR